MYLFLVSILGLALRLININKFEGLCNDEYVSWFVASTPFKEGFFNEILKQCPYLKTLNDVKIIIEEVLDDKSI